MEAKRFFWPAVACVIVATGLEGVYVPPETLAPLRARKPVAKVGWSLYVYDLRKHPGRVTDQTK